MATRTITLTPDATILSTWTRTGGSTQHGVVTDGSDATYILGNVDAAGSTARFDLTTAALSGVVTAARIGLRHNQNGAANGFESYGATWTTAANIAVAGSGWSPTATITTEEKTLDLVTPAFGKPAFLSQALVDGSRLLLESLGLESDGTAEWRIYEAYVELDISDVVGAIPVGF